MSAEEKEMAELLQQVGKSNACAWTLDRKVYASDGCDQLYQCRMLRIYRIGFGMEVEKSLYSDHEIRCLAEERRLRRRKDKYDDEDDDLGKEIVLAQDLEERWEQKLRKFNLASRITDADRSNDQTSLNRKLDQNLLLLVKQKVGDNEIWLLPQAEWQEGETLRATAERALVSLSGSRASAKFLGNVPCGVYKYKFPKAVQTESGVGAKVFFFKALLQGHHLPLTKEKVDYVWVSKGELADYLRPEYHSQVTRFVVDL
ncbi:hypothetical protein lerEdw1_010987 [Lerista edwardsae]|nr:hypothetical protein lerEdw1_010987 [Lerista edwardsae]